MYPKFYGKFYPKIYGNPTTHLRGEIQKIVRHRERCSKFEIGFLGSPISKSVIPHWKMDDFGGVEFRGWLGAGWLAEFAKNVGTKRSYTPPLGGKKTQAFLVAPPKKSFVGWLVTENFNFNRSKSSISISTGEVGSRHNFRASQMSEKFDGSSHVEP